MSAVTVFHGAGFPAPGAAVPGRHYAGRPLAGVGQGTKGSASVRLTRRGRVVLIGLPLVVLAALLLSVAGFVLSPAKAVDTARDLSVTPTVTVVVQPGSSLWGIAAAVVPERDPRDVVADIVQLNNLTGSSVVPGQQLHVPASQG